MNAVGRNEPCPCGSGKKYKKCCLLRETTPSGAWSDAERQSALVALGRFGWRHEFDGDRAFAETRFWSDEMIALIPERHRHEVVEQGQVFFQDWFTTDFRLASGHRLLDLFLEREGRRLRSGERRYLERARLTHLRPYEVVGVRPDEGLDLLDLWTRKRVPVRERLATHQVVQWNVLAARLMLGPDGAMILDGAPYLYPAGMKDEIMKELRGVHRKFRRRVPGDDLVDFFKRFGSVFFAFWLQHTVARYQLQVRTFDGDEVVIARAVFDIADRDVLVRALDGHPDLDRQDDGSYAWHEPGGEEFRRGLGAFIVEAKRVVLETMSRERAERGRTFLEALAGSAVRYRATSLESVDRAVERHAAAPARDEPELPLEVQTEVIQAFYDQHYRGWVDAPLPALGNRTPREAVQSKAGRSQVVALLKELESYAAHDRREGRPAYDFGWMWAELGLDRP